MTVASAPPVARTLAPTEALLEVLNLLAAGAGGGLQLRGRSSPVGIEFVASELVGAPWPWLPTPVVRILERRHQMSATVSLAVFEPDGRPLRCNAVTTSFSIQHLYEGSSWRFSRAQTEAAYARLATFPLAPSALIDGVATVHALWALTQPWPIETPTAAAAFHAAQTALANALGGDVPADDLRMEDLAIPLPLTGTNEPPFSDLVELVTFNSRTYTWAEMQVAIAAVQKGTTP